MKNSCSHERHWGPLRIRVLFVLIYEEPISKNKTLVGGGLLFFLDSVEYELISYLITSLTCPIVGYST